MWGERKDQVRKTLISAVRGVAILAITLDGDFEKAMQPQFSPLDHNYKILYHIVAE